MEVVVWGASRAVPWPDAVPQSPRSIFVLRNNDLGDLLIVTPLFEALRRRFPRAQIVVGVGEWNVDVLRMNPHISQVLVVNAPWHNKYTVPPVHGKLRNYFRNQRKALEYILFSAEARELARHKFSVGIDVLGSPWGSLLMLRAKIPYRIGVRGYDGGHTAVQQFVEFKANEHVGRSALRFSELLGAVQLPDCRPQIFLSDAERREGERRWKRREPGPSRDTTRIAVGPGAGLAEKAWPLDHYVRLVELMEGLGNVEIIALGGRQEWALAESLAGASQMARNLAGELSLRETFAVLAAADLVVCNSSMLLHAAAAFGVPTIVMLSDSFPSAREHDLQWGYETCRILGRDEDRQDVYTPEEAFAVARELIGGVDGPNAAGANIDRT